MTDELRKAAEDVLAEDAATEALYRQYGGNVNYGHFNQKAKALARAFLAEHPADDAERVTAEWLSALGWIDPPAAYHHPTRTEVVVRFGWHGPCTGDDSVFLYMAHQTVAVSPTRGHVRLLCRALGVQP